MNATGRVWFVTWAAGGASQHVGLRAAEPTEIVLDVRGWRVVAGPPKAAICVDGQPGELVAVRALRGEIELFTQLALPSDGADPLVTSAPFSIIEAGELVLTLVLCRAGKTPGGGSRLRVAA